MANRNFHKNLLLALGALGAIFGGVQKTSGYDALTLYDEADEINYYDFIDCTGKYDKAVYLMDKLLKGQKVEPTSRKNQGPRDISPQLAKAKFLFEASRAIFNEAKSYNHVSEDGYGKGAPKDYLNKIKTNAQLLRELGDSWGWPKGNYEWKTVNSLEKEYSQGAKAAINSTQDHIDTLFHKKANPLSAREKQKLDLQIKGYDQTSIKKYMDDYDEEHSENDPLYRITTTEN